MDQSREYPSIVILAFYLEAVTMLFIYSTKDQHSRARVTGGSRVLNLTAARGKRCFKNKEKKKVLFHLTDGRKSTPAIPTVL